jgi:hypothetical protein
MAHPCRPPVCPLFVAADSWVVVQLSPPSVERWNITGSGPAPLLRKLTLQTYTLPKNRLLAALSAHSCSLSLNVAELCLDTITGSIHALAPSTPPAAAAATSSVRDTAMDPVPLNAWSSRVEPKLVAMLA